MLCGAGHAEQQVLVAPGCRCQPRRFPAFTLPFLKIVFVFFSGQEEFEASLRRVGRRGQGCGTVLQSPGWVMPG